MPEAGSALMLAVVDNGQRPYWADPKYWALFIVVGQPATPAN
jgi:hypothetical protein